MKTVKDKGTIVAPRWLSGPSAHLIVSARAARLLGVVVGAEEMQRYVGLIADHLTVVGGWGDMKQISGSQFGLHSIGEGRHGAAGDDHSHMFDIA